jgi:hypothetical protein
MQEQERSCTQPLSSRIETSISLSFIVAVWAFLSCAASYPLKTLQTKTRIVVPLEVSALESVLTTSRARESENSEDGDGKQGDGARQEVFLG